MTGHTADHWLGYLAMTTVQAADNITDKHQRACTLAALEKFLESQEASPELREIVRGEMHK